MMTISTNPKPSTIYRNLYENTAPDAEQLVLKETTIEPAYPAGHVNYTRIIVLHPSISVNM